MAGRRIFKHGHDRSSEAGVAQSAGGERAAVRLRPTGAQERDQSLLHQGLAHRLGAESRARDLLSHRVEDVRWDAVLAVILDHRAERRLEQAKRAVMRRRHRGAQQQRLVICVAVARFEFDETVADQIAGVTGRDHAGRRSCIADPVRLPSRHDHHAGWCEGGRRPLAHLHVTTTAQHEVDGD